MTSAAEEALRNGLDERIEKACQAPVFNDELPDNLQELLREMDDAARAAFTQEIGIDDDWKAMVVVTDGDGDGATTSGVAKEH